MSSKEFCESGKHVYREIDVLKSVISELKNELHILVACNNCDSQFLRTVKQTLP